ncbi:MAG TPA: YebC/PmpR family DNA-binding transcriptional regulator [Candidatus Coprovivens excrementavium]|nr:YebC/PmpR family DNA-binding transcriptional regulator [Candidatus Coprovivens excrementavium]
MGRAYAVREAKIKKTGAAKGKLYTNFAKEIYLVAKNGVPEIEANSALKHLIEKAKKMQVPADIINRALDKAKGAGKDEYEQIIYEGFGPGSSTFMIKTLTDNVNRTVGEVRAAFNKVHKSLGVTNSVSYNYDNLTILSFKSDKEEEILMALLDAGVEPVECETDENGMLNISVNYVDNVKTRDIIESIVPNVSYDVDESGWYAKDLVRLDGEDLELFNRLYNLLDEIDDVTDIYHNVELD